MTTPARELDETALRAACGDGRMTAQRAVIARTAASIHGAFTVDELHRSAIREMPGIGVATAYRAVAAMAACGTLASVGDRDGHALYVWCAKGEHHHHVICTACGAVAGIDCPLPSGEARDAASSAGFTITHHELTLYGLCDECRNRSDD